MVAFAGGRAEAAGAAPTAADPDGAAVGAVLPRHHRLLPPPPRAQRALAHPAAPRTAGKHTAGRRPGPATDNSKVGMVWYRYSLTDSDGIVSEIHIHIEVIRNSDDPFLDYLTSVLGVLIYLFIAVYTQRINRS